MTRTRTTEGSVEGASYSSVALGTQTALGTPQGEV